MGIVQNSYTGFDTEFQNLDVSKNKLISIQLAVSTKTYLKIPLVKSYKISSIEAKSKKVKKFVNSSNEFNYEKMEKSIAILIKEIKVKKYGSYDELMFILNDSLRNIRGFSYFENEDYTIFSIPHSAIQSYIEFKETMTLRRVVNISTQISKPFHKKVLTVLKSLIKQILTSHLTLSNGKDNFKDNMIKMFGDCSVVSELIVENGRSLTLKEGINFEDLKEKRVSRNWISFEGGEVCLTVTKNNYIIAHLTQADLSMMSDFDLIKEDLSIVNGSFVTLTKPFCLDGVNIHIRDTMLLAPGGSKSLASIGKLYGTDLEKIQISKTELEDMQSFLKRDRGRFIEYALRDAKISLVHAF